MTQTTEATPNGAGLPPKIPDASQVYTRRRKKKHRRRLTEGASATVKSSSDDSLNSPLHKLTPPKLETKEGDEAAFLSADDSPKPTTDNAVIME